LIALRSLRNATGASAARRICRLRRSAASFAACGALLPVACEANRLPFSTSDASATHRTRAALVSGRRSVIRTPWIGSSV
jgi:hypothetical protein